MVNKKQPLQIPSGGRLIGQTVKVAAKVEMLPGPNQYPVYTTIAVGQEVMIWGEGVRPVSKD